MQGIKIEPEDGKAAVGDVEMMESSVLDDDEGDEGEGEGDEDEEGDGDESGTPAENEDQEMKDAPSYPVSNSSTDAAPTSTGAAVSDHTESNLNLAPPPLDTDASRVEGSPLKNVIIPSPTDPSPHISPIAVAPGIDQGLSEVSGQTTLGLEPSTVENQPQPTTLPEPMEVVTSDTQPAESTNSVSAEPAPEETPGMEGIISTEKPEAPVVPTPDQSAVSPIATEQPPSVEDAQAPVAEIPPPTSEELKPSEVPESEPEPESKPESQPEPQPEPQSEPQPEPEPEPEPKSEPKPELEPEPELETKPEPEPEPEPAPAPEPAQQDPPTVPVLAEPPTPTVIPPEQGPTDDGTDDGFNILGSLSDSLNRQAKDDTPTEPTAAPTETTPDSTEPITAPTEPAAAPTETSAAPTETNAAPTEAISPAKEEAPVTKDNEGDNQ